ncbi:MAG: polysaccharide biosynthesis protein [Spirochaetes bacterium]|nr:polysaccharide biosynthesis protein [Spirochaetota bacterium]
MFKNKVILITGGTGSWGNELTAQLLKKDPKEIKIFSRGEFAQVVMQRKFNDPRLNFVIGDIRDLDAISRSCRNVDYIFHLAALKHVPICEEQPEEAIKTNITGTTNLIKASIDNQVEKVIDVSTDKAVDPLNLYGMTKSVGEKLIIQANNLGGKTRFVCIRGGNVLGSNGSVVPYFIDQIKQYNRLQLTDKHMTRYFLTIHDAISLLFKAADRSIGGETFVMHMPACYILDIAKVLIDHYGKKDTKIKEIGMRPGEKIDEVLISRYEALNSHVYDKNYYLILPTLKINGLEAHYKKMKLKKVGFEEYNSSQEIMNIKQVEAMLNKGGFIQ